FNKYRLSKRLGEVTNSSLNFFGVIQYMDPQTDTEHYLALMLDISNGVRETPVEGSPLEYIKIYSDCWQHDPESRPDIQHVFFNLKNLRFDNGQ
ncbi:10599_t:CDS:2, partial [Gigaspora rosea]